MNKRSLYIVVSVVVLSLLMNLIDIFIKPMYFIRSIFKVVLFLVVPLIYFVIFKDEINDIKRLFIPRKKDLLKSILFGIGIYILIIGCYFLFRNIFDFSSIVDILTVDIGVNRDNLIYVTSYIAFFNSFLEEFFFRGFAFISLKKHTGNRFAYIFSALLFSLYHIGMITGWFHIMIYILVIIGIFILGCILNSLNDKCNNIYPSWLVHMFANFSVNTVGFILFDIL